MKRVKMLMNLRVLTYLLALLLALPVVGASSEAAPPSLEGTWVVKVLFRGVLKIQYLQTFTHDGKTTIFLPFGGPVNADDTRVACTGEWRRAGHGDYDVTMYCLGTQEWETAPDRIRARLTLDEEARTFTDSPFKYEAFLTDGTLVFSGDGVMSGNRLAFVPLD